MASHRYSLHVCEWYASMLNDSVQTWLHSFTTNTLPPPHSNMCKYLKAACWLFCLFDLRCSFPDEIRGGNIKEQITGLLATAGEHGKQVNRLCVYFQLLMLFIFKQLFALWVCICAQSCIHLTVAQKIFGMIVCNPKQNQHCLFFFFFNSKVNKS